MSVTQVAVFSEDRLFREALNEIVRRDPGFTVIASDSPDASGVHIAVVDARSHDAATDAPAPRGALRPFVVYVGASDDDEWAAQALDMGARGILTLSASPEELVKALTIVRDGGIWARRRWLNACLQRHESSSPHAAIAALAAGARLSRREEEVFRLAATGAGNKALAGHLAISEATVKVHLTRIFRKLGVSGRAELAAAYYGLRTSNRERGATV